jgi:hypothetical protein
VEDLAIGFFRGMFALVHAVARLAVEFFWHVVREAFGELAARIFGAICKAIAYVVKILLAPVEWLYRALFERVRRRLTSPALAHLTAMAVLMFCGFMIGAGVSLVYHHAPATVTAAFER